MPIFTNYTLFTTSNVIYEFCMDTILLYILEKNYFNQSMLLFKQSITN
jgi:hypothetical protein